MDPTVFRLVEDLIVESMANGEFDNLAGAWQAKTNNFKFPGL